MPDSSPFSPLSIAALNRLVRERLESGFPLCWVSGEISNLTLAASGHAYFTLKDDAAQVRCVMFRNRNAMLGFRPANGQRVEARVLVTLYEARGDFQLNVETMRLAGTGSLFERFQKLKAKLDAEGLFAAAGKRPLPPFPRRIGIVTSPQAAALRDVLTTLARRAPQVELLLFPTPVQGDGAAAQIAAAIAVAGTHGNCDLLLVCRGGGSLEDLWAFNEEIVARAIRGAPIPVITGIGHETDFTIADFAADLRAPTPTAAAEIAAPERDALLRRLAAVQETLRRRLRFMLDRQAQHLDHLTRRLKHPAERIALRRAQLHGLAQRLTAAAARHQRECKARGADLRHRLLHARPDPARERARLAILQARLAGRSAYAQTVRQAGLARYASILEMLNPLAVLDRGYAIVRDDRGDIVRDAAHVEPSAPIHVYLARGRLDAEVTQADAGDRIDASKHQHHQP